MRKSTAIVLYLVCVVLLHSFTMYRLWLIRNGLRLMRISLAEI